jgi:hypothetical protein
MPSVEAYVGYVEVEVDLEDYDTDDLIEELKRRGNYYVLVGDPLSYLRDIYELRRAGQDYQRELDELIFRALGRVS